MAPDTRYKALVGDLVMLGRAAPQPTPLPGLTAAVMTRLSAVPPPVVATTPQHVLRRVVEVVATNRRRAVAVVTTLLLALLATPPVRATVADWFGFAGVIVRHEVTPRPSMAPPPPPAAGATTIEQANALVAFGAVVPDALGVPQGVEVSADRRLLSMSWTGGRDGTVRLDQFDGRLDYTFLKVARADKYTSVAGSPALWFDEPHEVVVLNPDGSSRTETARLAGHTLIWQYGDTTLRLEGNLTRARARTIARSTTPLP